ncbi:dihydroneopterin aldolase [Alkalibacter rhizosphaerae]|uniref:7,8-dihydroneopterin aldolase n=1 Tax=Alkalibacter rhizosphaerae TaxID=2815577 RepID=A0A975AHE2_9FIRM|nr:dihydroneopterin aldolase [Alkalibacter rhizosphaerae]QSX08524.1 dihydroneopterin aldolase [Alkalibacter rhizosphaerae]
MDKIIMKNLGFYGYHGVLEEEKRLGQRFFVDAVLHLDLSVAGKTDDLNKTVHYGLVYETIKKQVEEKRYDLIEALGENICKDVLKEFPNIIKIVVQIRKPQAPVVGLFDYMAVELERTQEL